MTETTGYKTRLADVFAILDKNESIRANREFEGHQFFSALHQVTEDRVEQFWTAIHWMQIATRTMTAADFMKKYEHIASIGAYIPEFLARINETIDTPISRPMPQGAVDELLATTQEQMDEIILSIWMVGIMEASDLRIHIPQLMENQSGVPGESGEIRDMGEVLPAVDGTIGDEAEDCANCPDKDCPKHPEFKKSE